ncbi:hypothetical protein [Rufibacter soli]
MRFDPCEYLPYTEKDPRPATFSVGFGVMFHYRDVIGKPRECLYIEEYYRWKQKPGLLRMPKRKKYQRN